MTVPDPHGGLRWRAPFEPTFAHDARLMPAQYVKPYLRGQKNDFRDAEAIAEAVQRPRMRFVPTKSVEQLDRPRLPQRAFLTLMEKVPKSLALAGTE